MLELKCIPKSDVITVKSELENLVCNPFIHRNVLSLIAKVFDPLGLLAPVTITGKLIVQEIWKEERGWDVEVSPGLRAKVQSYVQSLV